MEDLQKHLENIVQICEDGRLGYHAAAERVDDEGLQTIFNRLSQQRKLFIEDLKNEARILGFELEEVGTVSGFFHRTWLSTKATFSFDNTETVIDSSITGEKEALEVYSENMPQDLPQNIKEKLDNQLSLIKGAVHQLSTFKKELVS